MFKSPNQRRMLFAMDKDKQNNPYKSIDLTAPAPGVQTGTQVNSLRNTTIPSLPGLKKMPKFGRVKKFFKNSI